MGNEVVGRGTASLARPLSVHSGSLNASPIMTVSRSTSSSSCRSLAVAGGEEDEDLENGKETDGDEGG